MNESNLETLLEKLQDNQLSDHECRELMQWFNEDESRVAAFADELRMSNSLAALQVLDSDGIVPAVIDSLSRAGVAADVSGRVRRQIETGLHSVGLHSTEIAKHSQRSSRKWVAVLIALAATVLLCLGWFALPTGDTAGNRSAVIAHVTHQVDAIWVNDHVTKDGGVKAGLLDLKSGFVRLDFDGGASVTLQGPAAYEITSPMDTRLHHGILTARIPDSAIGFTVETSAMDVVDLGTAFGVSVNPDGVTDVSVFEGSVEVRPMNSRSSMLNEGEAVRGDDEEGDQIASVRFDTRPFEQAWPVAFGVAQTTGALRFVRPGPPWDLTAHQDDEFIVVFPESERVTLGVAVGVDSVRPGEILRDQESEGNRIQAGKIVRSYLLQFNPASKRSDERKILSGEIVFSQPVLGVIWNSDRLAQTDSIFGSDSSQYDFPGRGIETPTIVRPEGTGRDRIFISEDRKTLSLQLNCSVHLDQIRVLVEAD